MTHATRSSTRQTKADLVAHLRGRLSEIEAAVLARVSAIADPNEISNPEYLQGLKAAVSAAIEFGLESMEREEDGELPPMPLILLAQARLAARGGVSLDTVLRRYLAGYSLLGYFTVDEGNRHGSMSAAELQRLLASQASILDRLLAAIGEEHTKESRRRPLSPQQKQAARIRRLINGELVDTAGIPYDFDGWHLGAVAAGSTMAEAIRELSGVLDSRLLLVDCDDGVVWGWLGSRVPMDQADLGRVALTPRAHNFVALGEPGYGLSGWRRTHLQARAALSVATLGSEPFVRYSSVALLAAVMRDQLLTASLQDIYLSPLEAERDGGELLRDTLRAYFDADRNVSSAAAALGVSRNTVAGRLTAIERRLDRSLSSCQPDLEIALRMRDLEASAFPGALEQISGEPLVH